MRSPMVSAALVDMAAQVAPVHAIGHGGSCLVAVVAVLAVGAVVGATSMSPTIHGATNATGRRYRALVAAVGAATAAVVTGAIVATAWNVARTIDAVAVGAMVGRGSS